MPNMKLDDRVNDLERRVSELEGAFQFLSSQVSGVHKSLINFQSEVHQRFDTVDQRFDTVEAKLDAMPKALASIIADSDSS